MATWNWARLICGKRSAQRSAYPRPNRAKLPTGFGKSEPFEQSVHGATGQVTVTATRVLLTPKLGARNFPGKLHVGETQLALQVVDANIASGRLGGELVLLREDTGLIARSRVKLTDADAAELLPGDGKVTGRLTLEIAVEGTGMSPVALIGALEGRGRMTLDERPVGAAQSSGIRCCDQRRRPRHADRRS